MSIPNRSIYVFLALCVYAITGHAQVAQVCVDRFTDGDAVPGTPMCLVNALTSRAGLSNFACTADEGEIAKEFCNTIPEPTQCPDGRLPYFDTGECPAIERAALERFDQGTEEQPCAVSLEQLPNLPATVVFVNQGLQFHPNRVLSNASLVSSGIQAINLVDSIEHAQQTGDTRPMANNMVGTLIPLLNFAYFRQIFQSFFSLGQAQPEACR